MAVAAVPAGGRELAELVPDHGLGDEHRIVLAPVMDGDGVADHLRKDVAAPRPGLDDPLLPALIQLLNLGEQVIVAERPFLEGTAHGLTSSVDARSCGRSSCCGGCGSRVPACPMGSAGAHRRRCDPRRLRAGGRTGSWPCRAPRAASPANATCPPCR